MDKWVLVTRYTAAGVPVTCYERTHIDGKSVSTRENLATIIGSWKFRSTSARTKSTAPHWLWRTCKSYRLTASGICFSQKYMEGANDG